MVIYIENNGENFTSKITGQMANAITGWRRQTAPVSKLPSQLPPPTLCLAGTVPRKS